MKQQFTGGEKIFNDLPFQLIIAGSKPSEDLRKSGQESKISSVVWSKPWANQNSDRGSSMQYLANVSVDRN